MTKKKARSLAVKAKKHLKAREIGRDCYAKSDALLRQMREAGLKPGVEVVINAAGDKVVLDDLYAQSDKVFRAHGIGRYELRVIKASRSAA